MLGAPMVRMMGCPATPFVAGSAGLPGRGGRAVALRPGGQGGERLDPVARRLGQILLDPREQRPVDGAAGHQLVVGALLDHPPVVQDHDAVGQMQRGLPVGDQQRGPVGHDAAQAVVDGLFDLGVDGAGGVVEDEDARIGHDGPGQGDPLALPARERQPALADDGVVAAGELEDELVGLGHPGRRLDLLVGGVGSSVGDVGPHRVGEEEALLEHDADLAAQRVQRDVAHVVPVDEDGAAVGVVEARDQHGDGRLAAPARTDDGHPLARRRCADRSPGAPEPPRRRRSARRRR